MGYARALAIMEDWRGTPELAMAATGGDVAGRVARLLGMSRQQTGARSAGVLTAALVLAAALMAGAASIGIVRPALSQIVAQVDGAAPRPGRARKIHHAQTQRERQPARRLARPSSTR